MLVAINALKPEFVKECEDLAEKYNLPLLQDSSNAYYVLNRDKNGFSVGFAETNKKMKPLQIDFNLGQIAYRAERANHELLAKAVGVKKYGPLKILDATAGLGRDGFLLATLGCQVTMLEKNPVLFILLQDALQRFQLQKTNQLNLVLSYQDANDFLKTSANFDVIYLDPMFPVRRKSALVKKEMQILHDIIGEADNDYTALLDLSLKKAHKRVVVKRPLKAEFLTDKLPDFSYKGKSIRFDVYLTINPLLNC